MNVKVVRTNSTCTVQVQVFQSNIYFLDKTINSTFLAPLSQPIGGSTKLICSDFVVRVCPLTDPLTEPCTGFLQFSAALGQFPFDYLLPTVTDITFQWPHSQAAHFRESVKHKVYR